MAVYTVYELLPRRSTCCAALYRHCCLLALLRALREEGSSMRNEDFVRQGGKVQCMWKASLFCILMMQCVYTHDCYCSWCVCVSMPPSRCRQYLGTRPYFYSSGMVLFTLQFKTVPCRVGTGVETVPCWHGTARFEHSSVAFTLVFRSVPC